MALRLRSVDRSRGRCPLRESPNAGASSASRRYFSFPALRPRQPESWLTAEQKWPPAPEAGRPVQPRLFRELRDRLGRDDFEWQSAVLDSRLAQGQPELINFYTHQPDSVQHWFWKWYEPGKYFGVRQADVAAKGGLIPQQQRAFDALLGRIEAKVSPDTVVLVVSDHGHSPTMVHDLYSQHRHGPPGILTLRGGPVRPGVKLASASVYDVYPPSSTCSAAGAERRGRQVLVEPSTPPLSCPPHPTIPPTAAPAPTCRGGARRGHERDGDRKAPLARLYFDFLRTHRHELRDRSEIPVVILCGARGRGCARKPSTPKPMVEIGPQPICGAS